MRKTIKTILFAATLVLLSSLSLFAQTRISFRRGATSATITRTIPPRASRAFVVAASRGQYAIVSVIPYNLYVATPGAPKGEQGNSSFTTSSGDNYFDIYNPTNHSVTFRMTITIR